MTTFDQKEFDNVKFCNIEIIILTNLIMEEKSLD